MSLRPLEPADRERLRRLFYRLSPDTIYRRFLSPITEPTEVGLDLLLDIDHAGREAVAAVAGDEVVGVARFFREAGSVEADIAALVEDGWQRHGLSILLRAELTRIARSRGITQLTATILSENRPAIATLRRAFPDAVLRIEGTELSAKIEIGN